MMMMMMIIIIIIIIKYEISEQLERKKNSKMVTISANLIITRHNPFPMDNIVVKEGI